MTNLTLAVNMTSRCRPKLSMKHQRDNVRHVSSHVMTNLSESENVSYDAFPELLAQLPARPFTQPRQICSMLEC